MSVLLELQQKRGQLAAEMRTLVDGVDAAKGLTAEQESQWKNMNDDLNALDKQIEQQEKMTAIEARLGEVPEPAKRPKPNNDSPQQPLASAAYEGGFTVPEPWGKQLMDALADNVVMRELGTVMTTGNTTNLPLVSDYGAAGWTKAKPIPNPTSSSAPVY